MKGEELVNKYNASKIDCFNRFGDSSFEYLKAKGVNVSEMYCYVAQGDIFMGQLIADLSLFTITDWNNEEVVSESEGLCKKVTMVMDRRAKVVTQTSTLINNTDEFCKGFDSIPMQSFLTDGMKILYPKSKK